MTYLWKPSQGSTFTFCGIDIFDQFFWKWDKVRWRDMKPYLYVSQQAVHTEVVTTIETDSFTLKWLQEESIAEAEVTIALILLGQKLN